jgi:hypothetical protein
MFSICRNVSLARCLEHLHLLSPTLTRFDGGRVQSWPRFYAPAVILARPPNKNGNKILKVETKNKKGIYSEERIVDKRGNNNKSHPTAQVLMTRRCAAFLPSSFPYIGRH